MKNCLKNLLCLLMLCCFGTLFAKETMLQRVDLNTVPLNRKIDRVATPSGTNILMVKKNTSVYTFKVPKGTWRKVKLLFRAKIDGKNTVENNPLYEIAPELCDLPSFGIQVKNKSSRNRYFNFRNFIGSNEWKEYGRIFYLKPQEEYIIFSISPKTTNVYIKDIRLLLVHEKEISLNGDLSFSPGLNSGIKLFERTGIIEKRNDGECLINTLHNGTLISEELPVTPMQKYRLVVKWSKFTPRQKIRTYILFLNQAGGTISTHVWYCRPPKKTKKEKLPDLLESVHYFSPPEKASEVRIVFYTAIIQNFSLKEVK